MSVFYRTSNFSVLVYFLSSFFHVNCRRLFAESHFLIYFDRFIKVDRYSYSVFSKIFGSLRKFNLYLEDKQIIIFIIFVPFKVCSDFARLIKTNIFCITHPRLISWSYAFFSRLDDIFFDFIMYSFTCIV